MDNGTNEIEFINKKTSMRLTAPVPVFMEDMAELFVLFATACGFQYEIVREYICPEGISWEVSKACAEVRKEYEMRDHPIEEDDEAR